MASDRVIDLLRKSYGDERETIMNNQTNAIVLDDVRAQEIKESRISKRDSLTPSNPMTAANS